MLDLAARPTPWTDTRVELLRKLWDDGLTCSQIAKQLDCGLSRNAVIGKASRLKLAARMAPERKARCYRSGPISYEEKQRREAARYARSMVARYNRRPKSDVALPPLIVAEPPQPVEFLALTFADLERDNCRYPRGEGVDIRYCGQPRMDKLSYCQHCFSITHYKPNDTTPLKRNKWIDHLTRWSA